MPFAGYKDFDACVRANSDKSDPEAYCATIMRKVEGENLDEVCIKCGKVREFWVNESSAKKMCTQCGNIERIVPKVVNVEIATSVGTESKKLQGMTYQGFIENSLNYYKKKFATEQVGMFYSIPQSGGVKKIKGLLAYAGVSLNNRLYLPEELAKGHEMTVPLLLNHSSTAGAEAEVPYLPQKYQDNLQRGIDTKVGEVTLHWDPSKLTLSYEGYVEDEYFINEVNEGKMGVSLGMVYDANSPKICNEQCYTMIKGAEFREVSLVYHPGFPIVTIESNEALLKQKALESIATEGEGKPHKFLSEYGFAKDNDPEKYNSECQSCGEPASSKLHSAEAEVTKFCKGCQNSFKEEDNFGSGYCKNCRAQALQKDKDDYDKSKQSQEGAGDLNGPNMLDMQQPFENKASEEPKIDENNDEIPEKEPNINVLNTNIQENVNENYMSNDKNKANEDAISMTTAPGDPGTVNPSGDLPAKGVPYDQCGDGMIWSASQQKCIPADTGSSTARGAPPTVKPISQPTAESYGSGNADRRTSRAANRENLRTEEASEAERALQLAEQRIRAKELFNREKLADAQRIDLQNRIKNAKENSQRKAIVSSIKPSQAPGQAKADAYESLTLSAGQWLAKVIAEEEAPMHKQWKINKENWLSDDKTMIQTLDQKYEPVYTPYNKYTGESKTSATEAVTGPPATAFMRIMSEQVLVLPGGKVVTPIRQFCETKILPPGTNQAQFYDFGSVTFTPITEDGTTKVGESNPIIRAQQVTTSPQGTMVTIGYTQTETSPVDLIAALNRAYALESVNQEAISVLNTAYNNDSGSSGDATTVKAIGGGSKTGYWVNGNTGSQITSDASGLSTLSFDGLKAAKGVIQDGGFDDSNLICYTSGKAIRDLQDDPNLDTYIGFSKPAIITEGVVERIAGVNLVRTSANAATSQTGGTRSVLFVPGLAFALASGRDLTMEAQRRNELQVIYVTGTQRITGAVKNVEVTCRLSTL